MNEDPDRHGLEPALELTSYVAAVKLARPGESAGDRHGASSPSHDTWLATVPIGYADGVRRALTGRLEVLIAGRRLPAVGTISMDNLTVAIGRDRPSDIGPETTVTLVGRDGSQRQTIEDLARGMGHDRPRDPVRPLESRHPGISPRRRAGEVSDPLASLSAIAPDVWLVGGAVRDELLGRDTADYDVVLAAEDEGTVAEVARALARAENGFAFALSDAFGAWRVVENLHRWQVDLTPMGGDTIDADLGRRDLTVNAIARSLGTGALVDPSGGREDRRAGRLRAVSERSFAR